MVFNLRGTLGAIRLAAQMAAQTKSPLAEASGPFYKSAEIQSSAISQENRVRLPVTATAVAAASTMEAASTAAAESAARAATITVRNAAAAVSATAAAYVATSAARIAATGIAAAIAVSAAIAEAAAPVEARVTVEAPVIPRPGADKQAAIEPVRTVVAVRCAGIRVIVVIAPRAIRRTGICVIRANHRGADAHSNSDLGARRNRGERKSYKQCQ